MVRQSVKSYTPLNTTQTLNEIPMTNQDKVRAGPSAQA
jgi:hypothetical protein